MDLKYGHGLVRKYVDWWLSFCQECGMWPPEEPVSISLLTSLNYDRWYKHSSPTEIWQHFTEKHNEPNTEEPTQNELDDFVTQLLKESYLNICDEIFPQVITDIIGQYLCDNENETFKIIHLGETLRKARTRVVGRDRYGVFPLKGKSAKSTKDNVEINNFKKFIGLSK
jgi:hypothetical protein